MIKIISLIFVLFFVAFFPLARAEAATFSFRMNDSVEVGEPFELLVELSADGDNLNAVSGEVIWPTDLLEVQSINSGASLVKLWIEPPKIKDNRIVFSGTIPGGFADNLSRLFSIVFVPKGTGAGSVAFEHSIALLNDANATPASVASTNWTFQAFSSSPGSRSMPEQSDSLPPEIFEPIIASSPDLFGGAYFLAFATQDNGLGIDHYEVEETRGSIVDPQGWQRATSPFRLNDQRLTSYIRVKAVDRAGNELVAELPPQKTLTPIPIKPAFHGLIIFMAAAGLFVGSRRFITRRKR